MEYKEIAIAEKEMDVLSYLSPVIQGIQEYQAIAAAENPILQKLWHALDSALKDQFVQDATIRGVKRMESILAISPKGTETIENRKRRILARMNDALPYTFRKLESWLVGVCGEENFSLELLAEIYQLTLRLAFLNNGFHLEIFHLIRNMIPANLILRQLVTYQTPEPAWIGVGAYHSVETRLAIGPKLIKEYADSTACSIGAYSAIGTRIAIAPYRAGNYTDDSELMSWATAAIGVQMTVGG